MTQNFGLTDKIIRQRIREFGEKFENGFPDDELAEAAEVKYAKPQQHVLAKSGSNRVNLIVDAHVSPAKLREYKRMSESLERISDEKETEPTPISQARPNGMDSAFSPEQIDEIHAQEETLKSEAKEKELI